MLLQAFVIGLLLLVYTSSISALSRPAKRSYDSHDYYVLEHDPTRGVSVDDCANVLRAEVVEPAGELRDHWLLRVPKDLSLGGESLLDRLQRIKDKGSLEYLDGELHAWKRDLVPFAVKHLEKQVPRQRVKRAAIPDPLPIPQDNDDGHSLSRAVAERLGIADPLFPDQWHLVNEEFPEHMVNATPVWDMGILGEGVISAMVDDGLDYTSEDLADNFFAEGSHDFNDHEDLPTPKLWDDHHGTRCAGQIAAVKNGVCGVGIAYRSKVAGVRILSGPITDVDEAAALNFGYQDTSIYSCSWGPSDDGMSMEAPGYLIQKAMLNGVQNGRDGKGSVFVFASGNGAYSGDQCNFDGYTNSIYSVTVAAIDYEGRRPYYSEACAANMVVTYSSGNNQKKQIVTTDVGKDKCTTGHGGTSAAAPNAVGIFALALSVRPDLSWRDIQHLCVRTAQIVNPGDEDWELTAAGRPYNYKFGFGKLDAYDFVTAARNWETVKPQAWIELPPIQIEDGTMDENGNFAGGRRITEDGVTSEMEVTWQILENNNFDKLEQITVNVWIEHTRRGDVEVELISPKGVKSMLAEKRRLDSDRRGFMGWRFMTVKHWDEDPVGKWTIKVNDQGSEDESGHFIGWSMSLWGSTNDAKKAEPYVLQDTEDLPFPPPERTQEPLPTTTETTTLTTIASTTKSYTKPTAHLSAVPTDDSDKDVVSATTDGDTASPSSTSEDSTSSDSSSMDDSTRFWIGVAGYLGSTFIIGLGAFLVIRQIRRRRRAQYEPVSDDVENVRMTSIDGSRVTGSGRDKHGDVVFDEEEEMRLTAGDGQQVASGPVGFHSGFLDDDEQATTSTPLYRDEPTEAEQKREAASAGASGSGPKETET